MGVDFLQASQQVSFAFLLCLKNLRAENQHPLFDPHGMMKGIGGFAEIAEFGPLHVGHTCTFGRRGRTQLRELNLQAANEEADQTSMDNASRCGRPGAWRPTLPTLVGANRPRAAAFL